MKVPCKQMKVQCRWMQANMSAQPKWLSISLNKSEPWIQKATKCSKWKLLQGVSIINVHCTVDLLGLGPRNQK